MLCFRILWTTGVNTSMTTMDRGRSLQCWGDGSTWSGTGLVGSGGAPASPDRGVRGRWGPALLPGAPGALTTMCRGGGGPALLPRAPGSPDRGVRERRGPALLPGAPGALTTMCGGGGGPPLLPGGPRSPDCGVLGRWAQLCCPGPLLHTAVRLSVPSGERTKSGRGWDLLLALGFI